MTWAAVHVYYHANHDPLIRACIGPALAGLREAGTVDRAFFLRYWQGGPHVRVRVRARDQVTADVAADRLTAAIESFLARCPSRLPVDPEVFAEAQRRLATLEGRDVDLRLRPDNTVTRAAYEPEYGKYGGTVGVAIAEKLFDASSRLVIGLLDEVARRPGRRLLLGLGILASGLREFGVAEPREFLTGYADMWSRYAIPSVVEQWPDAMARNHRAAEACVGAALSGRPPTAIEPWAAALRSAFRDLARAGDRVFGALSTPCQASAADACLTRLMAQYVHTTSNRLGLLPADEAYLASLAASVLPEPAVSSQ